MGRKKNILIILASLVALVLLWLVVFNITLNRGNEIADAEMTSEQIYELDTNETIYYEAVVSVGDKEYNLFDLTSDLFTDNVIVSVEVEGKSYDGYVVYSDNISKPQVRVTFGGAYAQVYLPQEVENE